jgi:hypothetical protein
MTESQSIALCLKALAPHDAKAQKRIAAFLTSYANDSEPPKKVGFAAASPSPQEPKP